MLLLVRLCLWWVGVLIGVVGVQRVTFLIADRTVGQNALRATTLTSNSAPGRTRTCDLLIRSDRVSGLVDPRWSRSAPVYGVCSGGDVIRSLRTPMNLHP